MKIIDIYIMQNVQLWCKNNVQHNAFHFFIFFPLYIWGLVFMPLNNGTCNRINQYFPQFSTMLTAIPYLFFILKIVQKKMHIFAILKQKFCLLIHNFKSSWLPLLHNLYRCFKKSLVEHGSIILMYFTGFYLHKSTEKPGEHQEW